MLPEAARLTIKFGGAIADSEDQVDTLGGIVAAAVGIQPTRLINGKVEIE